MRRAFGSLRSALAGMTDSASSGRERYKSLRIRVFLIIGAIAGIPFLILMIVCLLWLQGILKEEFQQQLEWQMENSQKSIEFFIEEKLSGLKFLASAIQYERLSDSGQLDEVFHQFKREFGELVDLGVIDSRGVQQAYAGPYRLQGRNYADQDWFHEVAIRGVYVSDVFLGYRKLPHFAVAVKRESPGKRTFWILRATIDMETLGRYLSGISLKENDDAFIINRQGILQTPTRFHGNVMEKISLPVSIPQQGITKTTIVHLDDGRNILGYTPIRNSPWTLGVVIKSAVHTELMGIVRKNSVLLYLVALVIAAMVGIHFRTTRTMVRWIEEAETRTEEAISESEHANKLASIGRLAAGVAHEINNPLAVINEKAGLMEDILEVTDDFPNRQKFLELLSGISGSVTRCRTITQRLLGFARRMDVTPEVFDLNEAIQEVIGFLEREMKHRSINLELNCKEDLPRIQSDRGQLQQVLLNIINNAIDAVEEGGRIGIVTDRSGTGKVKVSISDNGAGIPKEKMKYIFEPFYTTKEKGKGTGLGLSISYGIMKRLGGAIQVESEVGKGTTFTIEVPVMADIERFDRREIV